MHQAKADVVVVAAAAASQRLLRSLFQQRWYKANPVDVAAEVLELEARITSYRGFDTVLGPWAWLQGCLDSWRRSKNLQVASSCVNKAPHCCDPAVEQAR